MYVISHSVVAFFDAVHHPEVMTTNREIQLNNYSDSDVLGFWEFDERTFSLNLTTALLRALKIDSDFVPNLPSGFFKRVHECDLEKLIEEIHFALRERRSLDIKFSFSSSQNDLISLRAIAHCRAGKETNDAKLIGLIVQLSLDAFAT